MKLQPKSKNIVEETFAMYTEAGDCPSTLHGTTIVHLYPKGDTIGKDGELNGYYQNRFFEVIIFNIHNGKRLMYRLPGLKDAIFTEKANIVNISVFKDGAFCVKIEGSVEFLNGQAIYFLGQS